MRLNLDQPSAKRSTEIKICPDIESVPEIMINNLAQDVQNIRRIKTSSNVARLCSWETTRRQTYGGGAFSYFTLTGLAPKRVLKKDVLIKLEK